MPEGDTIFRAARTLHRALAGRAVTRFESVFPALARVDHDTPLTGRIVERVVARGKHLLMHFDGDVILHTHMRMNGSWHIYRPGERWFAPRHEMRVRLDTDAYVAVGFNIPVAEFLTLSQLARHEQIGALGPDLAAPDFDREEVWRRFADHQGEALHDVLLNQRVLSGIGNVLKSEVLFVATLDPFRAAGTMTRPDFDRLIDVSLRLMRMNIAASPLTRASGRQTTGSLDPRAKLFVYGRSRQPCRRCGTLIAAAKTGTDARRTYWCPVCQQAR